MAAMVFSPISHGGLHSPPLLLTPLSVPPPLLRTVPGSSRIASKFPVHASSLLVPDLSSLSSCALVADILSVDPWSPNVDSQSIASQLFAVSLFPYLGFLYCITKSKTAPKLTLFGFYFLLVFVAATIPAGIYAKVHYGTSLSNVDWLHGGAESFLTLTNLFIILGLRKALRDASSGGDSANAKSLQASEEDNLPSQKTSLITVSLEGSKIEENDNEVA